MSYLNNTCTQTQHMYVCMYVCMYVRACVACVRVYMACIYTFQYWWLSCLTYQVGACRSFGELSRGESVPGKVSMGKLSYTHVT